jgi:SAM-dependent methyltransferase
MSFKNFWENKHYSDDVYWLTGTPLSCILNYHNLKNEYFYNKSFLEIGVGSGTLAKDLRPTVMEYHCCDISENALRNLPEEVNSKWLTRDLNKIPPVDIALCHLVFQHCDDDEVCRIIEDVNLKDGGTFLIQSSHSKSDRRLREYNLEFKKNLFFRNVQELTRIINNTSKKIIEILPPISFDKKDGFEWIGWDIMRLSNK